MFNRDEGSQFSKGSITRIGVLDGGTLVPPTACEPDNRATFAPPFAYNTCVDRNGDGMITTSNGLIPLPWHHEDPLEFGTVDTAEDECIISYVELNAQNARHISVNSGNDVWVGGSKNNNTFDLVDGETGAILKTFDVGAGGYGGLIDCNDVLWSVGLSGNPGLFRYDTAFDIAEVACCVPTMLADSNGDGSIDQNDDGLQESSPMWFLVNSDDDNSNGIPDYDDPGPVEGENSLQEIQLFLPCDVDDPAAWWCLSWNGVECGGDSPTDTIRIWRHPDKSDGDQVNPGPGQAIVNGSQHFGEWPPPTSVWVEALETYDEIEIVFTTLVDPGGARGGGTPATSKLKTTVQCSPGTDGRWYVRAEKILPYHVLPPVTQADATFPTRSLTPLCGEQQNRKFPYVTTSAVFVSINRGTPPGPPLNQSPWFAQIGYARTRDADSAVVLQGVYTELFSGVDANNEAIYEEDYELTLLSPGEHTYGLVVLELNGTWGYLYDEIPIALYDTPGNIWNGIGGDEVQWGAEVAHTEDKLCGDVNNKCEFRDCRIERDWGTHPYQFQSAGFVPSDIIYRPQIPSHPQGTEWGKTYIDGRSFDVWDKNP